MYRKSMLVILLMLPAAMALSGCAGAVIGAGAAVGVAAAQERSIGEAVDDKTIHTQIASAMLQKSEKIFTSVNIEVLEGRVLLTGNVDTADDRAEAARIAWKVDGVREVLNEVTIGSESDLKDLAKDSWITTQVRAAILRNSDIVDINYSVETINAIVYLLGIAQNQAELDALVSHTRSVKGVRRVVSHVLLKSDSKRKK
jgi:osmotically-inducible protein OsmY